MEEVVKQILTKPIDLADQVIKLADNASIFKQECAHLMHLTTKLADLLRQAVRSSADLYEFPTRRFGEDAEWALERTRGLVWKCRSVGFVRRLFTDVRMEMFKYVEKSLENSIGSFSWLVRVSMMPMNVKDRSGDEFLGLPPILCPFSFAISMPTLVLIWEQIAILYRGSLDDRSDAAMVVMLLARDNDEFRKLIIEEGCVDLLLKLVLEGKPKGQENAVRAIGLLGMDCDSVDKIIDAGVCSVLAKILKDGPMKVQAKVAWAVSQLVSKCSKCKIDFVTHDIIRLLVSHLEFETNPNQGKYGIVGNGCLSGEMEDGEELDIITKANMRAMAARAIGHLAKDNSFICHIIAGSTALTCFAVLLDKGTEDVRFECAVALMEITAMAEKDKELCNFAFKLHSSVCRAVVDQLLDVIIKKDSKLMIPCVTAIGNLARIFSAKDTRIISALADLIVMENGNSDNIVAEALVALTKFACRENHLHVNHSEAILRGGADVHLMYYVYFGEELVKIPALILSTYLYMHALDVNKLDDFDSMFRMTLKQEAFTQNRMLKKLLLEAVSMGETLSRSSWSKSLLRAVWLYDLQ